MLKGDTADGRAALRNLATSILTQLDETAQPETQEQSIEDLLKSDDFWQMFWSQFWARLRKTAWVVIAGTVTALAILSTLVFNALRLWDRFFGGGLARIGGADDDVEHRAARCGFGLRGHRPLLYADRRVRGIDAASGQIGTAARAASRWGLQPRCAGCAVHDRVRFDGSRPGTPR